jgi:hypothetical protein
MSFEQKVFVGNPEEAQRIFDETEIEYWEPECGNVLVCCAVLPKGHRYIFYFVANGKISMDAERAERYLENKVRVFIASKLDEGVEL